jgi:hypothetical protein
MKRGSSVSELRKLSGMCWKGFRIENNTIQRWFYTDENNALRLEQKPYFNKNTDSITIYKGFETNESSESPISDEIVYISVGYHIANYFGDKSGMHFRNKSYLLISGQIFKRNENGYFSEVTRLNKELKGVLSEIK